MGKTNHSLRVTGASRKYECHIPEKLIRERTGHQSLDALRTYERASLVQQNALSSFIASTDHINYHEKAVASCIEPVPPAKRQKLVNADLESGASVVAGWTCSNCTINITVAK